MTAAAPDVTLRRVTPDDLADCGTIWRDALNDYMGRLNLPAIPAELAAIGRLHKHLLTTDPDRFVVAARPDGQRVAFASALVRDRLWFLSMLFVRPEEQHRGLGRRLLREVLPAAATVGVLATATDSAQPISNALYSSYRIVPRMPMFSLVGRPEPAHALAALPAGVTATLLDPVRDGAAIDALDRSAAGFTHRQDHAFVRAEGRRGFLYRDGAGRPVAFGYASEVGRVGPVAASDEALVVPVVAHLLAEIEPRGASAVWVAGDADRLMVALLAAGLRIDGFPVLLGWSAPFADFRRYVPISPGLL